MDYSKNKKAKKIFDEIQYNMYKDRMKLDKNLKPITKSKANYLNKQGVSQRVIETMQAYK